MPAAVFHNGLRTIHIQRLPHDAALHRGRPVAPAHNTREGVARAGAWVERQQRTPRVQRSKHTPLLFRRLTLAAHVLWECATGIDAHARLSIRPNECCSSHSLSLALRCGDCHRHHRRRHCQSPPPGHAPRPQPRTPLPQPRTPTPPQPATPAPSQQLFRFQMAVGDTVCGLTPAPPATRRLSGVFDNYLGWNAGAGGV